MGLYIFLTVLIIIVCVLLMLIVLVQNPKGGGLGAGFGGGAQQVMGARRTTDFLEKSTWTLAIVVLVLSLLTSIVVPRGGEGPGKTELEERIEGMPDNIQDFREFPVPEEGAGGLEDIEGFEDPEEEN